jgi:hypothetical protein
MEDFVNYLDATPIDPIPIRELETNADRSGPNNEHLLKIMIDFSKKSKEEIESMREKTNYLCHKNYSWDKAAGIWIDAIEKSLEKKKPFHGKWDIGPIIKENSVDNPPKNLNNFAFTEWIYSNFVQDGNEMYNYEMIDTIKELNFGATKKGAKLEMCDQNSILKYFIESIYLRKLNYDKLRCGIITEKSLPEFISEAHKGFNKE